MTAATPHPVTSQPQRQEPPLLYTMEDVTRLLHLSRSELYRQMARGTLHSVKCGRRRLVTSDELMRFVRELPAADAFEETPQ